MSTRPAARPTAPKRTAPRPESALAWNAPPGAAPLSERPATILALVTIAAFAAVALAMALGPHTVGDYMTETDFYGAYAEGARAIQQGRLDPSRYGVIGPGYEVALALVGFAIPDLFLAAELLSIACAVAIMSSWFLILRARLNASVAALAMLFLAVNGTFLRHAYSATTDLLAIALQAAALWLLLGRPPERALTARRAAAAGLVAALAFLTRYNGVALLPAGLAAILLGAAGAGPRAKLALAFAAGFAAPVLPWMAWSAAQGGGFSFQFHHNIAYDVFARARGIPWDDYQRDLQPQFRTLWDVIGRDPGAVIGRMFFNVFDHLRQDATTLLGVPVAACAALGALLALRDRSWVRAWPLLLPGALLFLTLVPVFYSERYSLAVLPAYATLAAIAFASPLAAMAVRGRFWLKPLVAVLPLAAGALASARVQAWMIDQLPTEVLVAADSLRRHVRPGDRIIARKSHIAWHGGAEPVAFPFIPSLDSLATFTRAHGIRWIYFSWPEAQMRPQVSYLLDTAAVVPGLVPRAVTRPHPAVLYEVGPEFGRRPAWLDNDTLHAYHTVRAKVLMHPADLESQMNLAGVARMLGRLPEAREALEHVLRARPREPLPLVQLGDVQLAQGDAAAAQRTFERALAIDPRNQLAAVGLGWAYLLQGQEREAASQWRPLIVTTRDPATVARMAELYAVLGEADAERTARIQWQRLHGGTP